MSVLLSPKAVYAHEKTEPCYVKNRTKKRQENLYDFAWTFLLHYRKDVPHTAHGISTMCAVVNKIHMTAASMTTVPTAPSVIGKIIQQCFYRRGQSTKMKPVFFHRCSGINELSKIPLKTIDILQYDCKYCYHKFCVIEQNSRRWKTLAAVFANPVQSNIEWTAVEGLLLAVGANLIEGRGPQVRFEKGDQVVAFHRPHPATGAKRYQARDARIFLKRIGVTP